MHSATHWPHFCSRHEKIFGCTNLLHKIEEYERSARTAHLPLEAYCTPTFLLFLIIGGPMENPRFTK